MARKRLPPKARAAVYRCIATVLEVGSNNGEDWPDDLAAQCGASAVEVRELIENEALTFKLRAERLEKKEARRGS